MIRDQDRPLIPGLDAGESQPRGVVAVRLSRRTSLGDGQHLDVTVEIEIPCEPVAYSHWLTSARDDAAKALSAAIKQALEVQ